MSMSSRPSSPINTAELDRVFWGRTFGRFIQANRKALRYSIGHASGLADIEASRWVAMEAGEVPTTRRQLEAIAAALNMEFVDMANMVFFCGAAWGF